MNFGLSDTQQAIKDSAREFFSKEARIADVRRLIDTDTAFDAALWRKMADQGWTGIIFPEEYGGFGMGMVEMAAALEEMGRALLPGPYLSTISAGALIEYAGNDAQKREYLGAICRGDARAAVALLEDSGSWSPSGVSMQARTQRVAAANLGNTSLFRMMRSLKT